MKLSVNHPQRLAKQRAHTATHMLHYFLDSVLGGTKQAGSLVDDDYLRFDFATKEALSNDQVQQIEIALNEWIINDQQVTITEMSLEEAKKTGAKAFFEDKYGATVRVVQIPHPHGTHYVGNSTEFCGGTHVSSTGMIGAFKITNQEAVASGIRRIEAVTGTKVALHACEQEQQEYGYAKLLDCSPKQIAEKIQKINAENTSIQQQLGMVQGLLVRKSLTGINPIEQGDLQYKVNLSVHGLDSLPLKDIVSIAKQVWPQSNRLLFTTQGQFALYAGASNNAKELQHRLGIQGGGSNELVQGKDISIVS